MRDSVARSGSIEKKDKEGPEFFETLRLKILFFRHTSRVRKVIFEKYTDYYQFPIVRDRTLVL